MSENHPCKTLLAVVATVMSDIEPLHCQERFATKVFHQWTKEVKITQGRVWTVGLVIKEFPFEFPNYFLKYMCCMRSAIVNQEQ
jgi:hypothetical protein